MLGIEDENENNAVALRVLKRHFRYRPLDGLPFASEISCASCSSENRQMTNARYEPANTTLAMFAEISRAPVSYLTPSSV